MIGVNQKGKCAHILHSYIFATDRLKINEQRNMTILHIYTDFEAIGTPAEGTLESSNSNSCEK